MCQKQSVGGRTHSSCKGEDSLDGLVVPCRFYGAVRKAIVQIKYRWVYDMEKIFADLIADNLWRFDLPNDYALVPVPLHSKRKKWRGFNQAEILARILARALGMKFADVLIREIDTRTQVGLKRDERKINVEGAFSIKKETKVNGKNIVLIDDVYTSGATMGECCRVLKKAGAKEVWAMAAALG